MKLTAIQGQAAREEAYTDAQTKVLQHLESLRQAVLAHGAHGEGNGPQWGHIGFLDEVSDRLQDMRQWFEGA